MVRELQLAGQAAAAETAGRFMVLKRVGAVRVTADLVRKLEVVFDGAARVEADRATRHWFASRRDDAPASGELADQTLAYYERALRNFHPQVEVDYDLKGERRLNRHRGLAGFLRWAESRRGYRLRALSILFTTPDLALRLYFTPAAAPDRSYLWGEGQDQAALEDLTAKITAAIRGRAGRFPFLRSWPAGIAAASAASLTAAIGVAFRLRYYSWPTVTLAAVGADAAAAAVLVFLARRAWPQVEYDFLGQTATVRRWRRAGRAAYFVLWGAFFMGGAWAVVSTFLRVPW